jgi:hypothetical protein
MSYELLPVGALPKHNDLNTALSVSRMNQVLTNEDISEIDITKLPPGLTANIDFQFRQNVLRDAFLPDRPEAIGRTATERAVGFAHRVATKLKGDVDESLRHHPFPSDLSPLHTIREYCYETSEQYLADRRPLANTIKSFISVVAEDQELWPMTRLIAGFHFFTIDIWLQDEYIDREVSTFATALDGWKGPDPKGI